jgi:hypothetical protein
VFYFIFVAVGFVLLKEKRDERKRHRLESVVAQKAATAAARASRSQ